MFEGCGLIFLLFIATLSHPPSPSPNEKSLKRGVCQRHGAKPKNCSFEGCPNQSQRAGLCCRHGGSKKRKAATNEGKGDEIAADAPMVVDNGGVIDLPDRAAKKAKSYKEEDGEGNDNPADFLPQPSDVCVPALPNVAVPDVAAVPTAVPTVAVQAQPEEAVYVTAQI